MPTVITHPAVALGMMPWFGDVKNSKAILFTGMLLTALPDIDVIGLRLGIPYGEVWGHRGITHSLFFAVIAGAMTTMLFARQPGFRAIRIWCYFSLCVASHGLLDALTNGGLGVAFFSPFNDERYFFPVTHIEVSTLNITRFFQGQGIAVLKSELIWVWAPCMAIMAAGFYCRKKT